MAWCANAIESQVVSATDFNSLTNGTLSIVAEDKDGRPAVDGRYYWETAATEISSTIKAKTENDDSDKYLAVDETVPLYRTMNGYDANTDAQGTSLATNGVYFTADVQFTASDETSGEGMVAEGDKLLVWLRATEAVEAVMDGETVVTPAVPATTNLIITAMNADGTGFADYVVANSGEGGINIDPATWYTLTIKAKQTGGVGEETAEFEVYVGDTKLASGQKTSFTSLVAAGGKTSTTITSVGFKGTGALDNLEFGTFTEVAQTFTATVTVNNSTAQGSATITVDNDTYVSPVTNENLVVGTTTPIVIVVTDELQETAASTLAVTCEQATPVWNSGAGTWTITVDVSQVAAGAIYPIVVNVAAAGSTPTTEFPDGWNGGDDPSPEILAKYATWAKDNDPTAVNAENAFLLNVAPTNDTTLAVTTIVVEGGTVKITSNHNLKAVNGVPYILTGDAPNAVNTPAESTVDEAGNIQYTPVEGETKKFYKIGVGYVDPADQE